MDAEDGFCISTFTMGCTEDTDSIDVVFEFIGKIPGEYNFSSASAADVSFGHRIVIVRH